MPVLLEHTGTLGVGYVMARALPLEAIRKSCDAGPVTIDIARISAQVALLEVEHNLTINKTYPLSPVGAKGIPLSLFLGVKKTQMKGPALGPIKTQRSKIMR